MAVSVSLLVSSFLVPPPLPPSVRAVSRWSDAAMSALAEDEWLLDGDDEDMTALSLVSAAEAESELTRGAEATSDDISALLDEWQEAQALADAEGTTPSSAEQQKMLASWSRMVADRERTLRKKRQRSLGAESW
eukprot:5230273-Prymnesium_polylepis.1